MENKEIAILFTQHCVSNTIIKNYHLQGKLTEEEIFIFKKEVLNKIYSFIELLSNPELEEARKIVLKSPDFFSNLNELGEPQFDDGWKKGIKSMSNEFSK